MEACKEKGSRRTKNAVLYQWEVRVKGFLYLEMLDIRIIHNYNSRNQNRSQSDRPLE